MARLNVLVVVSALLVSIAACSAARPEPAVNAGEWATAATAPSLQGYAAGAGLGEHHEHMPFTLLTKYIIRPSLAKEFAAGWLRFRKVVNHTNGSRTINLSKPLNNNLVFYSYEEWDCMKDFERFVKHNYAAHELIEFITEHDIPIEFTQLAEPIAPNTPDAASVSDSVSQVAGMSLRALETLLGESQETFFPKEVAHEKSNLKHGVRNNTVIILNRYLVKPSRIVQFVKAANLVTKAVAANEKGSNLVYGLSKPLDDDVTFYTYAIWEDKAAFKKHMESPYVKLFLKYILEQDIFIKATPLVAVEQMD